MRFTGVSAFSVFGLAAPIAAGVLTVASSAHAQDGANPRAALIQGLDGMLYGTTGAGGVGGFDGGTVFQMAPDGTGFTVLHSFGGSPTDGFDPGGLIQGPDGTLYGTTSGGGANSWGTIFQIAPDGSGYTLLYQFHPNARDGGRYPIGGLIQGADGTLYGTTNRGGTSDYGTVFRVGPDGSGDAVLHSFTGSTDGVNPRAGLMQGSDGTLYGTTYGTSVGYGTIFQIAPDGSGFTVLHRFIGAPTDGGFPLAGLIQGPDGTLYGTTQRGGPTTDGTVFQIAPDGSGFTFLHTFTGTDGREPSAELIQGADGTLYGTTAYGGSGNCASGLGCGTIFRLAPDGSGFTILYNFIGGPIDGANPRAGMIQGADGLLYGTTANGGPVDRGTVFQIAPDGSGFTLLHSFTGTTAAANPYAGLIQGSDGTLYGTTANGGRVGHGTVFQMAPDGSGFTQLYSFTGGPTDGATPYAGLIQGPDGTLYGTTAGTIFQGSSVISRGSVFRMAPDGSGFTQLHNFTDTPDGDEPRAGLILGADGMLYGTTIQGGSAGYGTVFRIAPDGTGFALLHSFTRTATDGGYPSGSLIQGSDGAIYGTTQQGGGDQFGGAGTVFKMAPDGSGFTILHSFTGNPPDEGADPEAGVIQGSDGTLYGTTRQSYFGVGTLFKMAPDGSGFTVVHRFTGGPTGGAYPRAGLIQGSDGTLYGTTEGGGSVDNGTVFQVAPDGSGFTLLHSFTNRPTDGAAPDAGLIQGSDGTLSGTTVVGGAVGRGTVFKMAPDGSGYTLLTSFTDTPTGGNRFAALVHVR
jgi:uncharacterized repeat protein (TIGR03803 family)